MAEMQERWVCPGCGTPLNIARLGIYAKVACPTCGHVDRVHPELGNFFIEGVLGLGGMSVVLRARDMVLDRPLAIKLLNEFYRDQPERIARFEHECELMAKVRHENVVSVYSAGWEKGQFYIAMELIKGRNLEELVKEGGMDPAQALAVIRQVTLGLDAAHRAGLLHRDMKPGNIIICDDGKAKVLDFGLSLGNLDEDTEEIIWATPFYVPPETLMREEEDLRTDIYALGMTLRQLVTGQDKFDSAPETIDEMLACKRALPRMAEVMPELDEAYAELIDHMTGYDPDSRPDSYASLLLEIDEVRHALSAAGQAVRAAARRRLLKHALIGGAVTLVLGTGAAMLTANLAKPEPVRQYITPESHLEWREYDAISRSLELIEQGDNAQACAIMAALADSEGEPTACAWAALHARLLTDLMNAFMREPERDHYQKRLEYHLTRTPAPAGQEMHALLRRTFQGQGDPPSHNLLAAVAMMNAAYSDLTSCMDSRAQETLNSSSSRLATVGPAYEALGKILNRIASELQQTRAERASRLYEQRYQPALASLNLQLASGMLRMKGESAADEAEKRRYAVQYEALELLQVVVDMLKRRSLLPEAGKAVSVNELQTIVARLGEPCLDAEVGTLMLMAQGNFEEAAKLNPYASDSSLTEFAVIMRDWFSRVK